MPQPKAYKPEHGYKYQILCRYRPAGPEWEHGDYAKDKTERDYLLGEYRLAYTNFDFKVILLPKKYWPRKVQTVS